MIDVMDPILESDSDFGYDADEPTFDDIDRTILECCGYTEGTPRFNMIFENVVADSDDKKIFTIDKYRSYDLDGATEEIVKDETFDRYWHKLIDDLDDGRDARLIEQLTDDFISEKVKERLNKLSKVEQFYYVDFFRDILSETKDVDTLELLDFDDKAFNDMPNVMRLY